MCIKIYTIFSRWFFGGKCCRGRDWVGGTGLVYIALFCSPLNLWNLFLVKNNQRSENVLSPFRVIDFTVQGMGKPRPQPTT